MREQRLDRRLDAGIERPVAGSANVADAEAIARPYSSFVVTVMLRCFSSTTKCRELRGLAGMDLSASPFSALE